MMEHSADEPNKDRRLSPEQRVFLKSPLAPLFKRGGGGTSEHRCLKNIFFTKSKESAGS
jgi:hypothetical protein